MLAELLKLKECFAPVGTGKCFDPVGVRSSVGVHIGYGRVRVPFVPTTKAYNISYFDYCLVVEFFA